MNEKIVLICLPYGGATASSMYTKWRDHIDDSIEIKMFDVAGVGKRIREPFYESFDEGGNDLAKKIIEEAGEKPFAIFGHCLGANMSFEIIKQLIKTGNNLPEHIFFSGLPFPPYSHYHKKVLLQFKRNIRIYFDLALAFLKPVIFMNLFRNKELFKLNAKNLINQTKLITNYYPEPEPEQLKCNSSLFVGEKEKYNHDGFNRWKKVITLNEICFFKGTHLFVNSNTKEVIEKVNTTLLQIDELKKTQYSMSY